MSDIRQEPNALSRLKTLLRQVHMHDASPELDRNIISAFPPAPPNVSRSIDAVVKPNRNGTSRLVVDLWFL
jgi:hypothetical protein